LVQRWYRTVISRHSKFEPKRISYSEQHGIIHIINKNYFMRTDEPIVFSYRHASEFLHQQIIDSRLLIIKSRMIGATGSANALSRELNRMFHPKAAENQE
jgi:hypothetical protein